MRRFAPILILLLAFATPAIAHETHDHVGVAHTHQTVVVGDYTAVFHFNAPAHPVYTCPMHPNVTSSRPFATCPQCKMTLEMQNLGIGVALGGAAGKPLNDARMRLEIVNKSGLVQKLDLTFDEIYQGALHLAKGPYDIKAIAIARGVDDPIVFTTTYTAQ
jgi:hypothetical protein